MTMSSVMSVLPCLLYNSAMPALPYMFLILKWFFFKLYFCEELVE